MHFPITPTPIRPTGALFCDSVENVIEYAAFRGAGNVDPEDLRDRRRHVDNFSRKFPLVAGDSRTRENHDGVHAVEGGEGKMQPR